MLICGAAVTGIVNLAAAVVSTPAAPRVRPGNQTALRGARRGARADRHTAGAFHDIETTGRQQLYADPIIAYRHSAYQEIVVTRQWR